MNVIDRKFSHIFKYMGIPKEEIRMDASFIKDFGFEEFQFGYLVFYIGSYFKINISECDYAELNTIGSTMDFVIRKVKRRDNLNILRREIRPIETLKSIPRNLPNLTKARNPEIYPTDLYFFLSNPQCAV